MKATLQPFGGLRPAGVDEVGVNAVRGDGRLRLTYTLQADPAAVVWPAAEGPDRRDGLWQHTCFEAFAAGRSGYREFNFSPSGAWAAYDFSGRREGMTNADTSTPEIVCSRAGRELQLAVTIPLLVDSLRLGLSAVIESPDGHRSYWALRHPAEKPDFHHPDSFVVSLQDLT